jgi:hypothetical protein
MFYHAIHARLRADGTFKPLLVGFSQEPARPPQDIIDNWEAMRTNPRIGEEFMELHRFLDNRIVERFQLPHPDEGDKLVESLRAGEAERAAAAKKASILEVQRALIARGLTVQDLAAAGAETPSAAPTATPAATADTAGESGSHSPEPPATSETRSSRLKKTSAP